MSYLSADGPGGIDARRARLKEDARIGLCAPVKSIPSAWFYDDRGSGLFDEITRLSEYYPTRTERAILECKAEDIVMVSGADTLVELGSGTSEKTRVLLDAMAAANVLERVVLFDIAEDVLRRAARDLHSLYDVEVEAVVGDLRADLDSLGGDGNRLWAFLGSTIGNFTREERGRMLVRFARAMSDGDSLLIGVDLIKDTARLIAAYDDSEGVTAEFNLNILNVLNKEMGGDFDVSKFSHRASWNESESRIEMRLRSLDAQVVSLPEVGLQVSLKGGEEILTEISTKFTADGFADELCDAGFDVAQRWFDEAHDFVVLLARPRGERHGTSGMRPADVPFAVH